ncbi:2',3'-cyclic-nucleotide 3'-phosphodiesterase-like [Littorina saxatilis]|uniref:2',3'-cyclic-nucleotide 3'-phosphodiesterase n=1 Tax=Littorina saxatilis TaxID=31220 RepID=A0AAN9BUG4_9CAEN
MLLSMFVSSASPVMVQECTGTAQSKQLNSCCTTDEVDGPICTPVYKLKHSRRKPYSIRKPPQMSAQDSTLDFPFLRDPHTLQVISQSKVFFIMRGLPGSGKSTLVRAITEAYISSIVCSADDYFFQDGEYKFDASCLSSAHEACQNRAKAACNECVSPVLVDNTNVRRWEMKFYLELASHRNYVVIPLQPKTPWRWNAVELADRNKHGVDVETLKRKVTQFDDVIPMYYAWFLNEWASKQLSFIAQYLLGECAQRFPAFADRLLQQIHISSAELRQAHQHSGDTSADADIFAAVLRDYYKSGKKAGCLVHCTAKFCGCGRAVGAKAYHAQPKVQNSMGQAFMLEISSICFSPRTIGARVKLGEDQLSLFDKPEESDWNGRQLSTATQNGTRKDGSPGARNYSPSQGKKSKGGKKKSPKPKEDNTVFTENRSESPSKKGFEPAFTKPLAKLRGRSAHITVACGPGFESRETNFDVLRLCDMEAAVPSSEANCVDVTGGKARYFDGGVCCVYFDAPLRVNTIYSGFY